MEVRRSGIISQESSISNTTRGTQECDILIIWTFFSRTSGLSTMFKATRAVGNIPEICHEQILKDLISFPSGYAVCLPIF